VLYHLDVGVERDVVMLVADESVNGGNYFVVETSIDDMPLNQFDYGFLQSSPIRKQDGEFVIEDMDLFKTHLVLYERSTTNASQRVQCRRRGDCMDTKTFGLSTDTLDINDKWSKLSPCGNICYHSDSFRFQAASPTTPGCVFEYSFQDDILEMISGKEILKSNITQEICSVKSKDGTKVPMTLFYDSGSMAEGPVVLLGYGAYGESVNLGYDPSWSPLLKRGSILAFAHTRGGGDLGKSWYQDGRQKNKKRSIDDFEACAMYLKSRFSGRPLTSKTFSAGGILLGALVNRQPDLFDTVVFTNAFLDVLHTMKNPSLFLTEHEYDEFGDPSSDAEIEEIIASYCPVANLDPDAHYKTKSKFLVVGTLDDTNVPYWNATLYSQKLANNLNRVDEEKRVFLDLQTEGGHNISGPNRIAVWALENAFLLDRDV
jgi:oligopeptidase B